MTVHLTIHAGQWLPAVQILLSLGAMSVYFAIGDYRKAIYWGAAAVLTSAVTF